MWQYWQTFIRPLCDILQPESIVEVGSLSGMNTDNLVEYCRAQSVAFHVIDPAPLDVDIVHKQLGEVGRLHHDISLAVLDKLPADLFLLDGDHNWYTVLHELRAISRCAEKAGRPYPVVCLHDIGWPYGRRDLYYAPERIPHEFRQPYAQRGLEVDEVDLMETGGFNTKHFNAYSEGGPRNGVLTAVEQFVDESDGRFRLLQLPGFHGLGVLYAPGELDADKRARLEQHMDMPEHVRDYIQTLEKERLHLLVIAQEIECVLGGRPGPKLASLVRFGRKIKRLGRNENGQ